MSIIKTTTAIGSPLKIVLTIIVLIIGIIGFILFFEGEDPLVDIGQTGPVIGKKGSIRYTANDMKSGLRNISISGSQGNVKKTLYSVAFPRTSYTGVIGPLQSQETINIDLKKEGFTDGPMLLTIEASDYSLRGWLQGNKTTIIKEVTIDTVPPHVQILHSDKYISPGGTGIAIYRLSETKSTSGVAMNGFFNPGYPLGVGKEDVFISFFALPYDAGRIESSKVTAVDQGGNETVVPFVTSYKGVSQKKDSIVISDAFLSDKIPEFQQHYPEMQGDFMDKYLYSNNTIRDLNNKKIQEICSTSQPKRLWQGQFSRMSGSSRAGFADHRSYIYGGKVIDHQVHLGMDIASTQRADVHAANKGKVVFADHLGIYGKMIVVDHGQGIFSLYSHLSQIDVAPGAEVDKKTVIGLTGTTGMAGGDHLHFAMLVNGIFVTPKEWWDQHWVEVNIDAPITTTKF